MNAYELADMLSDMKSGWSDDDLTLTQSATMLRQQQAEIGAEKLYSSMKHDEVLALKVEIKALKAELDTVSKAYMWIDETYKDNLDEIEALKAKLDKAIDAEKDRRFE